MQLLEQLLAVLGERGREALGQLRGHGSNDDGRQAQDHQAMMAAELLRDQSRELSSMRDSDTTSKRTLVSTKRSSAPRELSNGVRIVF